MDGLLFCAEDGTADIRVLVDHDGVVLGLSFCFSLVEPAFLGEGIGGVGVKH